MLSLKRRKVNRRLPRPGTQTLRWHRVAWSLAGTVMLATVVWGVSWLLGAHHWPVRTVRIQGELHHLSQAQLRKLLALHTAEGFFGFEVSALREALTNEPWVRSASVRRLWPDTVHVVLEEQVAAARWGDNALVNRRGELFFPPRQSFPQGLPHWQGPAGTEALVTARYKAMTEMIAPLGLRIASLSLDERRAWRLTLANGIDVRLGRKRELERLKHFVRIYPKVLAGQALRIAVVDLRYKNGFTVRWRPSPPPPARETVKKV